MRVKMRSDGHAITGIQIPVSDAHRLFPGGLQSIDLQLDHLRIRCDLLDKFWLDEMEISDPRLAAWLQEKFYWQKDRKNLESIEMVEDGDSYRLQLLHSENPAHRGFGLIV